MHVHPYLVQVSVLLPPPTGSISTTHSAMIEKNGAAECCGPLIQSSDTMCEDQENSGPKENSAGPYNDGRYEAAAGPKCSGPDGLRRGKKGKGPVS